MEGISTLTFKGASFAKIKADQGQMATDRLAGIRQKASETKRVALEYKPLPKEWTLKSNPLLPGLTEANLRALFQTYGAHYTEKQIMKFYAAPYGSTARKVVTDELRIPIHRTLDQWLTVFA